MRSPQAQSAPMEINHTKGLQGLRAHPVGVVLALSLGAAVSLGITRFAYALLLPVMRADLGWSYTLAGAMNTCLLYTSPSPRDKRQSRMPSSA